MEDLQEEIERTNKILVLMLQELKNINMNLINNVLEYPEFGIKTNEKETKEERLKRFLSFIDELENENGKKTNRPTK
ncbi:MAG: hypothetical protein COA94_08035 [Rickettsiales bacterium]|nr:MAG: hypothetical protein COA94_08035 [Rickettsiales bacterium]